MTEQIKTICDKDCPDTCSIIATVQDGRIIKHEGDPQHGITAGRLCYQGDRYLKRFYSKDRILFPQLKTENGWQQIGWEDALDLVVEKLTHYKNNYGPTSVSYINYSGIRGMVSKLMAKKFWAYFGGATHMKGGLSVEAIWAGQSLDFGGPCTHTPEDLENSSTIIKC